MVWAYKRSRPWTLRELLPQTPIHNIMVRTNDPYGGDMLFGYCEWDGKNLVSLDGDDYSLDEPVMKHEFHPGEINEMVYWIHSEWEDPDDA